MKYKYYFLNGTQEVRFDVGKASVEPKAGVRVNSRHSYRITYRTGETPIEDGGALRFSIPLPFTPPQMDNPRAAGYVRATCSRKGIRLALSVNLSLFTGFDVSDGHHGAFAYSVFVRATRGRLERGDTITLFYSRAKASAWSGPFDFAVGADPDGERRAKNSGYSLVAKFPRVFVEPRTASHLVVYLDPNLGRANRVTAVARDSLDNFDRNFAGRRRLTPRGASMFFKKGVGRARALAGGKDVLRVRVGRDLSNPAKKLQGEKLFWGDLHTHSLLYDGIGTPAEVYTCGRDVAQLDFQSVSEHSFFDPSMWEHLVEAAEHFNRPGRFVAYIGYEARTSDFGDVNFYFPTGRAAQPPPAKFKGSYLRYPLRRFIRSLGAIRAIAVPHQHLKPRCDYPTGFQKAAMPLIEVYSQWGNFEKAGRTFMPSGRLTVQPPQSIIHNLVSGLRFGLTAGSDNHACQAGYGKHMRHEAGFHGGLTAVYARERTRKSIWTALLRRRCYATTGCRMILDFSVGGVRMGSSKKAPANPRQVRAIVHGQGPLKRVVVVRNGKEVKTFDGRGKLDLQIEWTDKTPIEDLWLPKTKYAPTPFVFYYVRAEQGDGEIGWTSPVWLDR